MGIDKRIILAIVVLLSGVIFAVYGYLQVRTSILADEQREAAQEVTFYENRNRLTQALRGIHGITPDALLRGFWYTYLDENGNEVVAYLNVDDLALRGLSDAEIIEILEQLKRASIVGADAMRAIPFAELPSNLQFHNNLYAFRQDSSFIDTKKQLESNVENEGYTSDDLFRLSYLYELEGRYEERDELNAINCQQFSERCDTEEMSIVVTGRVVDRSGDPVQNAEVTVLSREGVPPVTTDAEGVYRIDMKVFELEKVRIRATKRNYSDGVASVIAVTDGVQQYAPEDIVISSPVNIVTVDLGQGTVTGSNNSITPEGDIFIRGRESVYEIPHDGIVYANGNQYRGVVEIYVYEFDQDTVPEGLVQADTFDDVRGFAGDSMQTFGMPYIQFFSPEREELHVLKSNPMTITYQMQHLDDLKAGSSDAPGNRPLTDAELGLLVAASRTQTFPIDRDFLLRNDLAHFPAFWVFDRTAGIWENVGIEVLTLDGQIRSPFYTLRHSQS